MLYVKSGNKEFLKLLVMQQLFRSCPKPSLLIKDGLLLRGDKENAGIPATELPLQGSGSFSI